MYHNKQSIDYVKIVMLKKALQKMTLFFVIGENWLIFDFYSSHVANNTLMLRALLLYYSQELWSVRSHSMALKMVDVASCMFRQKCRASAAFTAECLMTNKTAWGYTSAQIRHGIVWDETIHFFRHLHDCCAMFFCGMNIDIF